MLVINNLISFVAQSYRPQRLVFLFVMMIFIVCFYAIACLYIGVGQPLNEKGEMVQLLDTIFNYSQEQAYQHLAAYTEQGRAVYLFSVLFLDTLFPLAYGIFLALLLAFLLEKTSFRIITLLPLLLILVDYIENSHIALLLINYPEQMPQVAYTGSLFTSAKWILIGILLLSVSLGCYIKNLQERLK